MTVVDLKFPVYYGYSKFIKQKGMANVYRKNNFCSIDGLPTNVQIPQLRPAIPRQLQNTKLFLVPLEAGASYIFDRGYIDFVRFYRIHQAGAFYVTRAKSNFDCQRICSNGSNNIYESKRFMEPPRMR